MVFRYPQTGLTPRYDIDTVAGKERIKDFVVVATGYSTPFSFNWWASGYRNLLRHTHSTKIMLSLLLVNEQIFEEACTHFYRLNLVYFFNVSELEVFPRVMPVYRRQHLSQLAFRYRPGDAKVTVSAFRYLASMPNLRKLYIHISEGNWTYAYLRKHHTHTLEKFDPLKIPGLQILRGIRGLDNVVFDGDCPTIAAYLKPEMERKDSQMRKRKQAEVSTRRSLARAAKPKKIGRD